MPGDRTRLTVRLLVAAAALQVAFGLASPAHDVGHLVSGEVSRHTVSGLMSVTWLPVMVGILWWTVRQMGWFGRQSMQDAASIAAAGATSHEWHWEVTADLVVTYSNDRVQDLLGVPADEIVGSQLTALLADEDPPRFQQVLDSALATGAGWHDLKADWRHADGHLVTL